jgi:hypothetical protein
MRFTAYFIKGSRSFILPQGASQARALCLAEAYAKGRGLTLISVHFGR